MLSGAAPERLDFLKCIWNKCNPVCSLEENNRNVTTNIYAKLNSINFDQKTLDAIWLLGFNGWNIYELFFQAIQTARMHGLSLDGALHPLISDLKFKDCKYQSQIAHLALETGDAMDKWPQEIPRIPHNGKSFDSPKQKFAYELVLFSTAFVFLHELRHVMFNIDGNRPSTSIKEENECDKFAKAFLLDTVEQYALLKKEDVYAVFAKRSMGIALGSILLFGLTPKESRYLSSDHPSISNRIKSLMSFSKSQEPFISYEPNYWAFASSLLIWMSL